MITLQKNPPPPVYAWLWILILGAMVACTKEKIPITGQDKMEDKPLEERRARPDFNQSRLICQLGNFYGDWLNYQNGKASLPFHELRLDTTEVVMPSSWSSSKSCYEVDPITQQMVYDELSTAVGTAETRVNTSGMINPHVVAVAVEIIKPKHGTSGEKYQAPFTKGEIDTIKVGNSQQYKFRVITAVGFKSANISILEPCLFTSGIFDIYSAASALSAKANNNPCWPHNVCQYYRDVKYKQFDGMCGNSALYHVFGGYCVIDCSTCSSFGCVYPNFTFTAPWMNYFLNQGRNLAMAQGYSGYDIVGYQWSAETCLCDPCGSSYGEYHKLSVTYGKCSINVPS